MIFMEEMMQSDDTAFLQTMIANPQQYRFKLRCYCGQHNDKKVGAVEDTVKAPYIEHAMNKGELERVVEAKRQGKIAAAHVAATKLNGTPVSEFCGSIDAEKLQEKLRGRPTRIGSAGEFYTFTLSFISDEEDPF
jgi:hypothetical protein